MSAIKSMLKLKYLQIYADVDDAGMKQLEGAPSLEYLQVHSNDLKGDGLKVLTTMPNLTNATIGNSQLNAESLDAVQDCKKLKYLDISTKAPIDAAKIEPSNSDWQGAKWKSALILRLPQPRAKQPRSQQARTKQAQS